MEHDEVTQLIRQLESPRAAERRRACDLLAEKGEAARPAMPELVFAAQDRNAPVRASAARAFAAIARAEPLAVIALATLLKDPHQKVRLAALEGLQALGPVARAAVPQLIEVLEDPDWMLVGEVLDTLASIGPAAALAAPKLFGFLTGVPPGLQPFFLARGAKRTRRPQYPEAARLAADVWYDTVILPATSMALQAMGYDVPSLGHQHKYDIPSLGDHNKAE